MCRIPQASHTVEWRTEEVAVALVSDTRMQCHPHRLAPLVLSEGPLRLDGRPQCRVRRNERRVERIPDRLEDVAAVPLNDHSEDGIMPRKGVLHRVRRSVPATAAADDIGEQERDGAGWWLRHDAVSL